MSDLSSSDLTDIHRFHAGTPTRLWTTPRGLSDNFGRIGTAPIDAPTSHRSLTHPAAKDKERAMTKPSKITRHDPRHGTNRGYNAGCREDCCRHAHMIYKKLWYMGRTRRYIDATGTRRRLEGLAALGYSMADISARLGMTRTYVYQLRKSTSIRSDNAAKVGEVFEQLCMTLPDHPLAVRARRHAAKVGWLPPLAWDDIDDPDEIPDLAHDSQRDTLAEYRWLVAGGVSHEQAAKQLNITMNAIERAIDRERKAA